MSLRFKGQEVMKRTHARKRPQKVAAALGAVLVTASCATAPTQNAATLADQSSRYDGVSGQRALFPIGCVCAVAAGFRPKPISIKVASSPTGPTAS